MVLQSNPVGLKELFIKVNVFTSSLLIKHLVTLLTRKEESLF